MRTALGSVAATLGFALTLTLAVAIAGDMTKSPSSRGGWPDGTSQSSNAAPSDRHLYPNDLSLVASA
jgi:hypothetical protein